MPFYSGWGLTVDKIACRRKKKRKLSLTELVSGALIVYPRYIDQLILEYCKPELLVERIKEQNYLLMKKYNNKNFLFI